MVIGGSSLSQGRLFAAEAVDRIAPVIDANQRVDTNSGINKRFKLFEPDAVTLPQRKRYPSSPPSASILIRMPA